MDNYVISCISENTRS